MILKSAMAVLTVSASALNITEVLCEKSSLLFLQQEVMSGVKVGHAFDFLY